MMSPYMYGDAGYVTSNFGTELFVDTSLGSLGAPVMAVSSYVYDSFHYYDYYFYWSGSQIVNDGLCIGAADGEAFQLRSLLDCDRMLPGCSKRVALI